MPINEISKGVFYLSTPKTDKYKMSAAGQYTTTFTKAKADLWDLSVKQAAQQIESAEEAYQLQMKSYLERQKQLDNIEAEMNLAVQQGNQKAINDAYKNWISVKAAQDRANADRALRATEKVYPTASTSYGLGTGFGAGVRKAAEKLSPEQAAYIKAKVAENAGNVGATLTAIDEALGPTGILRTSTPEIADAVRAVTMNEIVNVQVAQTGEALEDAMVSVGEEANIVDPSENYTNAYAKMLTLPEPPPSGGGAGAGAVSRVSGPVTRPKFTGTPGTPPVDTTFPSLQLKLLEEIKLGRTELEKDKPLPPSSDLITTARDIFAGRGGPTMGASAPYKQRLVLDTLLRMSPEERESIVKKYGGAQPAAEAVAKAAEATPPAAPAPAPIPPGTSPYRDEATGAEGYLTPGNEKVETKPGTAAPAPVAPEITGPGPTGYGTYVDPVTGQEQTFDPSSPTGIRIIKPGTTAAPPTEPTVTPPAQAPMLPQTPAPSVPASQPQPDRRAEMEMLGFSPPVTTTREANAPAPVQRTKEQMEESLAPALPTIPSINKPLEVMRDQAEKPKVPEAPPGKTGGTASTSKGRQLQYVDKVYEAAKELLGKKEKLSRVTSSGEGKLASEIYFGNKNKNKDFKTTWEEITLSFADSPTARERAHTIAMALDLRSKSLAKTPEVA